MGAFDDIKDKTTWKSVRPGESAVDRPTVPESDPTSGMSAADLLAAGYGKRLSDIGTLGLREKQDADKALMNRGWAQGGAGLADLTTMLGGGRILRALGILPAVGPALRVAGESLSLPNTALRAGTAGGLYAAATTPGSLTDRAVNGVISGGMGMALPVGGSMIRAGQSLLEPLSESGQKNIAGRLLSDAINGDSLALSKMGSPEVFVQGSNPTTAEAVGTNGLAKLQQGLKNSDPLGFGNQLAQRQAEQRAARMNAISGIAQDDAAYEVARKAREDATNTLYQSAKGKVVEGDSTLNELLNRDVLQQGLGKAEKIASNEGRPFALQVGTPETTVSSLVLGSNGIPVSTVIPAKPTLYSGQSLHDLKMGIDDAIDFNASQGMERNLARSQEGARSEFLKWLENKLPEYGIARETYAELSKPLGQMKIGQALRDKLLPAITDWQSTPSRETANAFAGALRNADDVAKKATGFDGSTFANTMTQAQKDTIEGVAKDLGRKATTDDLIRDVGSNTASNLATQNLLRRVLGPLGLPQSWAEATIPQTILKPLNMIYGGIAEPKVANQLGLGLLNPQYANQLILNAKPGKVSGNIGGLLDYTPALGIAAGINQ